MHRWWGKALWALKYLGIEGSEEESTITLQFFWMPSTGTTRDAGKPWDRKVYREGEAREVVEEWRNKTLLDEPEVLEGDGNISAVNAKTFRALQSGHTIELSMTRAEAFNMKAMVELQWAMIKIATMSGAAGDPEFESGYDRDGNPIGLLAIHESLESPVLSQTELRMHGEADDEADEETDERLENPPLQPRMTQPKHRASSPGAEASD